MQRNPRIHTLFAGLLGAAFVCTPSARGGQVEYQLGEQDFSDGQTPVWAQDIRGAGAGEPYPFDGTIFGDDEKPVLGQFQYVHDFDLGGAKPMSARLTIGLLDIDSPPDDDEGTIALYFNGVRQNTAMFVGISDRAEPSSAEVVSLPVPAEFLKDGRLTVRIEAVQPGLGETGNSVEADFSRLVIQTQDAPPGPQPGDGGGGAGGNGSVNGGSDPGVPTDPPTAIPLPSALGMASVLVTGIVCARGVFPVRRRRKP